MKLLLIAIPLILSSCQTSPAKAAAMQSAASAHGQATVQLFSKPIER
jgi:hypothetical protein